MKTKHERNELRRQAYELHVGGKTPYDIHKALGVSVQTACNWIKRFAERGEDGIVEQKRGPTSSPHATLSPDQRKAMSAAIDLIRSFGIGEEALHDTRFFGRMIARECGRQIPPRSVRRWMHRFGLGPVVPLKDMPGDAATV